MSMSDPSQQSRPNIFGDDYNYPAPNSDWNRFTTNYYVQPNFPFCSNYGPNPVTFPITTENDQSFVTSVHNPTIYYSNRMRPNRCKRKTEFSQPVRAKQYITEEKMAEHLSKLHLSSESATSNEQEDSRERRLYMCEEMRKLQTESILPASLLNKIQRPCTALVLWQPPERLIPAENNDNNNEEEIPDNNLMDLDSR